MRKSISNLIDPYREEKRGPGLAAIKNILFAKFPLALCGAATSLVKGPLRRSDQRFGDVLKSFALNLAKAGEELT